MRIVHTSKPVIEIDSIVMNAMEVLGVPGASVAVVKDGAIVHCEGYGLRKLGASEPVTPKTVFAIASCTKAFTATAAAMLVDDGKIGWDDLVRKHIPFFRLTDPVADRLVTIRDLLNHRTGMPRADALWFGSSEPREELLRRACLLPSANPFRSQYEYNNLMYTAAGYALGLASGLGYEGLIRERIVGPLGMFSTFTSAGESQAGDHATPHALSSSGQTTPIPWRVIDNVCPTGGIGSCAQDMGKWLLFQLANGMWEGRRLVSGDNLKVTRVPGIMSSLSEDPNQPTIAGYAMGWEVFDIQGVKVLTHSGGIDGFSSQTTLLPRASAGFTVLTNSDRLGARAIHRGLLPLLGGFKPLADPLQRTLDDDKTITETAVKNRDDLLAKRLPGTRPSKDLSDYAASYVDPAYGAIRLEASGEGLNLIYNGLSHPGEHFHHDIFLFHPPFVQPVESLSTVSFGLGLDGQVQTARWQSTDWGIDTTFRRV